MRWRSKNHKYDIEVINDNCFNVFKEIEDESVDLILTDPPYTIKQDSSKSYLELTPLTGVQIDEMFKEFKRILKRTGNVMIWCADVFSFQLYNYGVKYLKYKQKIVWVYKNPSGYNARGFKYAHENLLWFVKSKNYYFKPNKITLFSWFEHHAYGGFLRDKDGAPAEKLGVTPKPLTPSKYLVKALCPKGGLTIDPFLGTGTTGVACINYCNFIGIEKKKNIYEFAVKRIDKEIKKGMLRV